MRTVGIFCFNLILFNYKFSRKKTQKFPMDKDIGHHFTKDMLPETDPSPCVRIVVAYSSCVGGQYAAVDSGLACGISRAAAALT